jgi:ABC-type transport system involved in cytochrome c biogenesis permease subunit
MATRPIRLTHWLLLAAAVLLGAEMAARSIEIGFFALTNMYESLAFYALAIALVVFGYRLQKRLTYNPVWPLAPP